MELADWGTALGFILTMGTIIGTTVINIKFNKIQIQNELKKQKNDINLEKMADLPYLIVELYDFMVSRKEVNSQSNKDIKGFDKKFKEKFKNVYVITLAYGSKEAIIILSEMQQLVYTDPLNKKSIAYYPLMVMQIKYDLTNIEVSPEHWYKIRITDFEKHKDKYKDYNNEVVKNLKLHSFLEM